MNLDSSKASGPDCIPVVVVRSVSLNFLSVASDKAKCLQSLF